MSKYIDAEKLKELIDEKWKELADKNVKVGGGKYDIDIYTYLSVLRLIDSLQQEQTEADLEKDIEKICDFNKAQTTVTLTKRGLRAAAYHFYELGLNARKEE